MTQEEQNETVRVDFKTTADTRARAKAAAALLGMSLEKWLTKLIDDATLQKPDEKS